VTKRIILKKNEDLRIRAGHPWVYDNEVERICDAAGTNTQLEPGETADVESANREYLGRAITNPQSKIIARIYSPSKDGLDKGFIKHRLREARERRARAGYDLQHESCRICFSEADFLPGLIVDRFVGRPYNEALLSETSLKETSSGNAQVWLSVQFLSYGMDMRRSEIISSLSELEDGGIPDGLPLGGIIEKSAPVRSLEGLDSTKEQPLTPQRTLQGSIPAQGIVIEEDGIKMLVRLAEGQKTGCYLDQRDNRRLAAGLAQRYLPSADSVGLDCCSYTGGFALHLAAACPTLSLNCVDVSASALQTAGLNARLNGLDGRITTTEADVFDFLRQARRRHEKYDIIVLDPPAFAKSHKNISDALRGYREINRLALELLRKGGILVSCSCSQAVDEGRFKRMLEASACDAKRRLYEMAFRGQAGDHPVLLGFAESHYLKAGFYQTLP
jgi:23S rRNA (cytosine1962-C5)-methyltransferase